MKFVHIQIHHIKKFQNENMSIECVQSPGNIWKNMPTSLASNINILTIELKKRKKMVAGQATLLCVFSCRCQLPGATI